jgi:hypothetical protein
MRFGSFCARSSSAKHPTAKAKAQTSVFITC